MRGKQFKKIIILFLGTLFVFYPQLLLTQTDQVPSIDINEELELFEITPEDDEETSQQEDVEEMTKTDEGPITNEVESQEEETAEIEQETIEEVAEAEEEPVDEFEGQEEEATLETEAVEEIAETEEMPIDEIEEQEGEATVEAEAVEEIAETEEMPIDEVEGQEEEVTVEAEAVEEIAETEEEPVDEFEGQEEETTAEIESIDEDIEDLAEIEEDEDIGREDVESNQQAESLIEDEIGGESDQSVLSQAVLQAEEIGLSASFIKLPFEESKQERLARLQQDEYFDELIHISQTGVHQYSVTTSPVTGSVSLKAGLLPPPSLNIEETGRTYESVYGESSKMILFINYEWKILKNVGDFSLSPELGFSWATGTGQFEVGGPNCQQGIPCERTPKEKYFLLIVPINLGITYRLQYWQRQILVPYAVGGGSYFGLLEMRDDFRSFGVAATPAIYFGGGIQFLLDSLSTKAVNTLDREFGINHLYIVAEARRYIGLSQSLNFSGFVISGGVRVDF